MEQIFLEIILRYMENKDMIAVTAREVKDASDWTKVKTRPYAEVNNKDFI